MTETHALTNPQKCILMMSGMELWIDEQKANTIIDDIQHHRVKGTIVIDGGLVNLSSTEGIYTPQQMEDLSYKKRGYYRCDWGKWHPKNEICQCGEGFVRVK